MIKKIFVLSFFVVFIAITSWLFVKSFTIDKLPLGSKMPAFTYQDTSGTKLIDKEYPGRVIIVLFSIDCTFCKSLLININKNISKFGDTKLYFISKEENVFDLIKKGKMRSVNGLLHKKEIQFGFIKKQKVSYFDVTSVPVILVYDINRTLVNKFKGNVDIKDILL